MASVPGHEWKPPPFRAANGNVLCSTLRMEAPSVPGRKWKQPPFRTAWRCFRVRCEPGVTQDFYLQRVGQTTPLGAKREGGRTGDATETMLINEWS